MPSETSVRDCIPYGVFPDNILQGIEESPENVLSRRPLPYRRCLARRPDRRTRSSRGFLFLCGMNGPCFFHGVHNPWNEQGKYLL